MVAAGIKIIDKIRCVARNVQSSGPVPEPLTTRSETADLMLKCCGEVRGRNFTTEYALFEYFRDAVPNPHTALEETLLDQHVMNVNNAHRFGNSVPNEHRSTI
ncbi:uncharacterized protein N7506_006435 [Penicillium brevicompactum]|uniref:uncharacterized protein n=1 Tax=Penicillium brevicompactum TaxID=5074 RepID=UPI0025411F1F|nr:uncharacterized protein N7506_006435 [Penicillium brevicompactum]KAJ5332652.1 hypothetical protein N7506_006435 [Penicillium brevicompactum]